MPEEEYFHMASVRGSFADFSKLDLSPWGIEGGLVEDLNTENFIKEISIKEHAERNWKHIKDNTQNVEGTNNKHSDYKIMNLLWPKDINNPPKESDYFEAIEAIRVIHPSELFIQNTFGTQYIKEEGIYFSSWATYTSYSWHKYQKPEDHYFYCPEDEIEETNHFLALIKDNFYKQDYIRNAIRYYSDSFRVNSPEMAFLCLCICLETIVPGREQLSFRFRRNLAVLCSESHEKGKRILKKAKQLYEYRSKLVHSGMSSKDFEKFDLFFEYAQILASRMIIEMILHDMPSITELDKRITELGFGQGRIISQNYNPFKGNAIAWHKVSDYNFDQ